MAAELKLILSAPALSRRRTSATVRTPPPTVSGMNTCDATASMIVQDQVAPIAGSGDVQKGEFVGALRVVARRDLDRVAGVAQFDEVDTLDDTAAGDVQAGDDSFGEQLSAFGGECRSADETGRHPKPARNRLCRAAAGACLEGVTPQAAPGVS